MIQKGGDVMAITMQYIYETYRESYALKLLAGQGGMGRQVSWVYYSEDRETTSFLYGNELIITTGMLSRSPDWLLAFCKSLIQNQASGLVVNTGRYITSIPEEVISYCEENHFPLFSMPWEIHIIDVSRGICGKIQEEEKTEYILSTAFHNAILYPDTKHMYESVLIQHGFLPEDTYQAVCIQSVSDQQEGEALLSVVPEYCSNIPAFGSMEYCLIHGSEELILVFCNEEETKVKEAFQDLEGRLAADQKGATEIHVGIGRRVNSFYELKDSYEKAHACAMQAARQNRFLLCFSGLGLKKLLLSIHDRSLLQDVIQETIAPILAYDRLHHTEYLKVLRMYIETDCAIQEIANATYTHRNTINYRIGKIKEILGKDLSSMPEKVLFQTAFYILDLLEAETADREEEAGENV